MLTPDGTYSAFNHYTWCDPDVGGVGSMLHWSAFEEVECCIGRVGLMPWSSRTGLKQNGLSIVLAPDSLSGELSGSDWLTKSIT